MAKSTLKVPFPYEILYRGSITIETEIQQFFVSTWTHSAFETANRLSIKIEITRTVTGTDKISCRHQSFDATATSARGIATK